MLLAERDDIQVVGEARNGLEAISLSKELEPDVILMDLQMPIMDGIEATRQITAQQPHMRVVAVNSFVYPEKILSALKAGAVGYVRQESAPSELIQSIYKVHRGERAFDQSITRKLMEEISKQSVNPNMTVRTDGGGEWEVQSMQEMKT
jgi:DNA-binding NarL/FixJ family response regulator